MKQPRKPLAERLRIGLEEALAHARGELTLKTTVIPEPPPEIDAETLVKLRTDARMSQSVFAGILGTSTKTVQSWEQKKRVPSKSALRVIQFLVTQPSAACAAVGLRPIEFNGYEIQTDRRGRRQLVKVGA